MEHQYPGAISGDENMLAELMLPDQAHARKEDWTVFFLHKDTTEEDGAAEGDAVEKDGHTKQNEEAAEGAEAGDTQNGVKAVEGENKTGAEDGDAEGGEGPPLIYVLNLVNTKHDASAKRYVGSPSSVKACLTCLSTRGAVVKAMAICTRHPFLHIYKVATIFHFPR